MPNDQNDERALWDSYVTGDKTAYANIYRLYYPRLINYGRKFTSDAELIEDCVQEIFVQFWMNRKKLSDVQSMRSYLFVSFRHALLKSAERTAMQSVRLAEDHHLAFHWRYRLTR